MEGRIKGIPAIAFDLGNTLLPYGQKEADLLQEKLYEFSGASDLGIDRSDFNESYAGMVDHELSLRNGTSWESDPAWRAAIICEDLAARGYDVAALEPELITAHPRAFSLCLRFPDRSIEVLEELKARGVKLALISNAMDGKGIRLSLQEYGADRFLDPIIVSEEERIAKPDPRIFLKALAGLGVRPSECAYVGDRYDVDVVGSQNVGMVPVYTREYHTEGEPPEGIEVRALTVRSLDELPGLWGG